MENIKIENSWKSVLNDEFYKTYLIELIDKVKKAYKSETVYPAGNKIFNAFNFCSFENTRVVIIGQDPYHGPGQANGLCFSVNEGINMPPSLINIFKEIRSDLKKDFPENGNLERWAKQGILLLNSVLTVKTKSPGSHKDFGWEIFTDAIIENISLKKDKVVFLLWGAYAQKKGKIIDRTKHFILSSSHPSPFSAYNGFFGNQHFSKTNNYLKKNGLKEIDW
ncbi:MAG: uracil-DNA glycosylase [Bacteroidetes bacterium]|nr:uracil-DNA glycosylase [Bacteroidota bacterium]